MIALDDLRVFPIFEGLTDNELANIQEAAKLRTYRTGERIFDEDSIAANLFLLKSGRVAIRMRGEKGRAAITVEDVDAGEIFGWSAVAEPHSFTAAAYTEKDSEILVLPGEVLRDLFKKNNRIGYIIMSGIAKVISSRLRNVHRKFASSG